MIGRLILLSAVILLVCRAAWAQVPSKDDFAPEAESGLQGVSGFSILDPSKISMNQSYSFGYYSGGGRSGTIGMYLNSIEYQVSKPLRIGIDLGLLHQPGRLVARSTTGPGAVFLPGFSLDYRPGNNFHFRLEMKSYANPYGSPYLWGSDGYASPWYRPR